MTGHNRCYPPFDTVSCEFSVLSPFQILETLTSPHQDYRRLRVIPTALDPRLL